MTEDGDPPPATTRATSRRSAGRPARRPRRLGIVVCLAALAGAACEVRDEPVGRPATPALWPGPAAAGARGRADASGDEIHFVEGYEAAARQARAAGRPLLVVFRATWCRWSSLALRGPLAEDRIVTLSRRCVCTLVDADRDAATCVAFAVAAFPTVVVVDPDGRERFRGTGAALEGLATVLDTVSPGDAAEDRLADESPAPRDEKAVTR